MRINIAFSPWSRQDGFGMTSLQLFEKIGGDIAHGKASFEILGEEARNISLTECSGEILINGVEIKDKAEYTYKIPVYVVSRTIVKNIMDIQFICVPDIKFISTPRTTTWPNITDALNALYPNGVNKSIESDLDNETKIWQSNETDHEVCTRLAYSFKRDTVFAFGWEGFTIKDLNIDKPETIVSGSTFIEQTPLNFYYKPNLNAESWDTWSPENEEGPDYTENTLKYPKSIQYWNKNTIVRSDYTQIMKNYNHNKTLVDENFRSSVIIQGSQIPTWRIGDVVNYKRVDGTEIPPKKFFISSNELIYNADGSKSGYSKFKWVTKLLGLEEGEWSKNPS